MFFKNKNKEIQNHEIWSSDELLSLSVGLSEDIVFVPEKRIFNYRLNEKEKSLVYTYIGNSYVNKFKAFSSIEISNNKDVAFEEDKNIYGYLRFVNYRSYAGIFFFIKDKDMINNVLDKSFFEHKTINSVFRISIGYDRSHLKNLNTDKLLANNMGSNIPISSIKILCESQGSKEIEDIQYLMRG